MVGPVRAIAEQAITDVHLLPNYDEYFIGFKDRSAIGQRLKSSALVMGGDALTAYVVAVDGQLVGGWKRTRTKDAVIVELTLLTRLNDAERRAVTAAAKAYGAFLGLPVELRDSGSRRSVSS